MHTALSPRARALRRTTGALAIVAILGITRLHAQTASFDCTRAATVTERAICSSPSLGRQDVEVATYYRLLLRLKPAEAGMAYREFDDRLRDQQRQWIADRRDACKSDVRCLGRAYDQRIQTLLKTFDDNAALTFTRTTH